MFRYKGQAGYFTDTDSGLIYCHHRYYDPLAARWITRDPAGLEGGINTYQYCDGSPLTTADPSGLQVDSGFFGGMLTPLSTPHEGEWILRRYAVWAKQHPFLASLIDELTLSGGLGPGVRAEAALAERGAAVTAEEAVASQVIKASGRGIEAGRVYEVYQYVSTSGVRYVGMTKNFIQRRIAQASRFPIEKIPGLSNLTYAEARGAEQALIEFYKLGKNGGPLLNKINSIARTNPAYAERLKLGREILCRARYPGF